MSSNLTAPTESAKSLYERLKAERQSYVTRAVNCAKYTIPSIFPDTSNNSSTNYNTPYQAVGARGVNNLSSKLMLALLPPNAPFFRLSLADKAAQQLSEQPDLTAKVEVELGKLERKIMSYIETNQIRVTVSEAIKNLVVAGNALLFLPPKEGGIKLYTLNNYVIQRDGLGNTIRIVTHDSLDFASLPPEIQSLVSSNGEQVKPDKKVEVYTHTYLELDKYISYQEVDEKVIPGSDQTYPKDKTPWIPMRMVKMDGEHYGRSFVEEYLGDLKSLEALSKSIIELAAIAANVVLLVNPNGVTRVQKVAKAKPGEFVSGRKSDIEALTLDKYADLQVAKSTADGIESRLSYAFMLNSAVQRQGERVTAEEIRYVASELEDTLGGVYSILSQEFQLPLVRRLLTQLQSIGQIPNLPQGSIEPSVTTGLEALGRGHDLDKLDTFLSYIKDIPEAVGAIKMNSLLLMVATSLNIDADTLIKSDEEVAQEQQAAQQASMLQNATPQLAKGFADAQLQQPVPTNQGGQT